MILHIHTKLRRMKEKEILKFLKSDGLYTSHHVDLLNFVIAKILTFNQRRLYKYIE